MAIEKKLIPYELLHRWNDTTGAYEASHVLFIELLIEDGVITDRKLLPAMTPEQAAALGFPFPAVLDQLLTDALVELDKAKAEKAELERQAIATAEAHAAEVASLNDRIQGDAMLLDGYRRDRAAMIEQLAAVEAQLAEAQEGPLKKALAFFAGLLAPKAPATEETAA